MISISAYRRYPQPQWYYRQTQVRQDQRPAPPPRNRPRPEQSARPEGQTPPPSPPPKPPEGGPPRGQGGIMGTLGSFLPEGVDSGDIFLAAMLLFLYSESHDEEFLIILIVVGLSIFQKDKDKK